MNLYFARHGESEANVSKVFSNRGQKHPLTQMGRDQAKALGERLQGKGIECIFTSPLLRAKETAQIVSSIVGAPIEVLDGLREHDCGLEGRTDSESWKMFEELMNKWSHSCFDHSIEGGESYQNLRERFAASLDYILARMKNSVIVSHGSVLCLLLPEFVENLERHFTNTYRLRNCEFALTSVSDQRLSCICWAGKKLKDYNQAMDSIGTSSPGSDRVS